MLEPGTEPGTSMISSQKLWPLDHEAGHKINLTIINYTRKSWRFLSALFTDAVKNVADGRISMENWYNDAVVVLFCSAQIPNERTWP
jgi:hypothetical protein